MVPNLPICPTHHLRLHEVPGYTYQSLYTSNMEEALDKNNATKIIKFLTKTHLIK